MFNGNEPFYTLKFESKGIIKMEEKSKIFYWYISFINSFKNK